MPFVEQTMPPHDPLSSHRLSRFP